MDKQPPLFPEEKAIAHPSVDLMSTILGLSHVKGVGKKAIATILGSFADPVKVWEAGESELAAALQKSRIPKYRSIAHQIARERSRLLEEGIKEAEELRTQGITLLFGEQLPEQLRLIDTPPMWLFVQGDPEALFKAPLVAVVGTRKPSEKGLEATRKVVRMLAAYPVTLVSGLAEGIDEQAHKEALEEGLKNVAFLGHGINLVFPKQTARLREQILDKGGAVASEYLPNETYSSAYFVERNRLQAALVDLVVPIEGQAQSGTAHTVRFALRYRKRVIGVAWSGAEGILSLIRKNACEILPVFTREGLKQLDAIVQEVVRKRGLHPDPLARIRKRLAVELGTRCFTMQDVLEFLKEMEKLVVNQADADKEGEDRC